MKTCCDTGIDGVGEGCGKKFDWTSVKESEIARGGVLMTPIMGTMRTLPQTYEVESKIGNPK